VEYVQNGTGRRQKRMRNKSGGGGKEERYDYDDDGEARHPRRGEKEAKAGG
jgi:hypothetical protein